MWLIFEMDKNADVLSPRGAILIYLIFYLKLFLTYTRSGLAIVWSIWVPCLHLCEITKGTALENVILSCLDYQEQGHRQRGRDPVEEDFDSPPPPPPRGGAAKQQTKNKKQKDAT